MSNNGDQAVRDRLARIEGQVRGIQKMLTEGRACHEVLTQMLAVRTALEAAAVELVDAHIQECLEQLPPGEARPRLQQAVRLLARMS